MDAVPISSNQSSLILRHCAISTTDMHVLSKPFSRIHELETSEGIERLRSSIWLSSGIQLALEQAILHWV